MVNTNEDIIDKYMREIPPYVPMPRQKELALLKKTHSGDWHSRNILIESNLYLVVKIAHSLKGFGLPFLDLIEEGNMGLIKAIERFDPKRKARLATYACFWIRQKMRRAIAKQSQAIEFPEEDISAVKNLCISMNQETSEFKDHHLIESNIPDEIPDVSRSESIGLERLVNRMVLRHCDEREAYIIRMRFGLNNSERCTLAQLAQKQGLTTERIRQIQRDAMLKLRKAFASIRIAFVGNRLAVNNSKQCLEI